jgi:imidazoleglycerol phosphate synthase glutamine amidotransferase subunit HisH
MIEYKQLEKNDDAKIPCDVELITDDSDAEMAGLKDMIEECGFEIELPEHNSRGEDGNFHVIIPGGMVGEFSDCVYEIDNGKLDKLTEKWNEEALAAAEEE